MKKLAMLCCVVTALSVGVLDQSAHAQTGAEQQQSSSRTRVSGRSAKGMVKIAIFGGAALIGGGLWAARKLRGQ